MSFIKKFAEGQIGEGRGMADLAKRFLKSRYFKREGLTDSNLLEANIRDFLDSEGLTFNQLEISQLMEQVRLVSMR